MKHFILEATDYAVIEKELFRLYKGDIFEITAQFHTFFRDTLENWPDFKTTNEYLKNKDFLSFPNIKMDNLIKYKCWPRGDDYSMQSILFHHFQKKGVDISEHFSAIAAQETPSLGPLQGKYAVMYSEGLLSGVFINHNSKHLLDIYDYLSDRNNNHAFNNRLLYVIDNALELCINEPTVFKEIPARLNKLLSKYISSENIHLQKILEKIKDKDFSGYPYIQKAILFKDDYCIEKEGFPLTINFDLKKMQENFKIDEREIAEAFNSLISYYQNNSENLIGFFSVQKDSVVKIVATFETSEIKTQWKKQFDAVIKAAENQAFGKLDVKDLLTKAVFAMKLEETLSSKSHKQKLKKI
jgi:hypothetical protein